MFSQTSFMLPHLKVRIPVALSSRIAGDELAAARPRRLKRRTLLSIVEDEVWSMSDML